MKNYWLDKKEKREEKTGTIYTWDFGDDLSYSAGYYAFGVPIYPQPGVVISTSPLVADPNYAQGGTVTIDSNSITDITEEKK
jgi:hypothetical protein